MTKVDPDLRGFTGGFAAGHWGFLVPFKNKEADGEYSGKMVRFDLRTFDHAGVTVNNLEEDIRIINCCTVHLLVLSGMLRYAELNHESTGGHRSTFRHVCEKD